MIMDGKRDATVVADMLQGIVSGNTDRVVQKILRCISIGEELIIPTTTGARFIASAKDVFKSGIDSDYAKWGLAQVSVLTKAVKTEVHEMTLDATFAQMFGSLSADLDLLCFTQDQIIAFCTEHRSWVRTDGYGTFFLFKENEQYFLAGVRVDSDGLDARVLHFGRGVVWSAEFQRRLVVPQRTL